MIPANALADPIAQLVRRTQRIETLVWVISGIVVAIGVGVAVAIALTRRRDVQAASQFTAVPFGHPHLVSDVEPVVGFNLGS